MVNTENDKWNWIGTIETSEGQYVDILNLQPEMVSLEDIANSLCNICRFNGHLPFFYSVAEHSVFVAEWLANHGFDNETILTGLLHDAAEAYVGDMMRPLKRVPDMEAVFKPIEEHAMKVIHQVLGGIYPHPEAVFIADKEAYEWEVANIRTGKIVGMSPDLAYEHFMEIYYSLTRDTGCSVTIDELFSKLDGLLSSTRREILNEAADLVDGDRNAQYGDPIDDFRRTATYWSTHIGGILRRKANSLGHTLDEDILFLIDRLLDPHDVAIMMGQLKDSRLAWDPYKKDTWTDKAGYSACGYDCAVRD